MKICKDVIDATKVYINKEGIPVKILNSIHFICNKLILKIQLCLYTALHIIQSILGSLKQNSLTIRSRVIGGTLCNCLSEKFNIDFTL